DHLECGRLAGAVRPEKTGDRACANGERQVVDRPDRAVALRQPLDDNRCDLWGNTIRLHADRIGHDRLARIGSKTELRLRPEVDKTRPDLRLGIDDLGQAGKELRDDRDRQSGWLGRDPWASREDPHKKTLPRRLSRNALANIVPRSPMQRD